MLFWNGDVKNQFKEASGYTKLQERQAINTNESPSWIWVHPCDFGRSDGYTSNRWVKPLISVWMFDTFGSTNLLNSGPTPIPWDLLVLFSPVFPILGPVPSAQVLQSDTSATSLPPFPPTASTGSSPPVPTPWPGSLSQPPFPSQSRPLSHFSWFSRENLWSLSLTYGTSCPIGVQGRLWG